MTQAQQSYVASKQEGHDTRPVEIFWDMMNVLGSASEHNLSINLDLKALKKLIEDWISKKTGLNPLETEFRHTAFVQRKITEDENGKPVAAHMGLCTFLYRGLKIYYVETDGDADPYIRAQLNEVNISNTKAVIVVSSDIDFVDLLKASRIAGIKALQVATYKNSSPDLIDELGRANILFWDDTRILPTLIRRPEVPPVAPQLAYDIDVPAGYYLEVHMHGQRIRIGDSQSNSNAPILAYCKNIPSGFYLEATFLDGKTITIH